METDPTRVVQIVVGLGVNIAVDGVTDVAGEPLRVHVRKLGLAPVCFECGARSVRKDTTQVELVDLAAFGRPCRLVWSKRRSACPNSACQVGSFTEQDPDLAPPRAGSPLGLAGGACRQVGQFARPVSDLATELGTAWHTVNAAVISWGQRLLEADTDRVAQVHAVGLDETLAVRQGVFRQRVWATTIADVERCQLIDVVEGHDAAGVCALFAAQPDEWVQAIRAVTMDMSTTYLKVADTVLPHARQIVDRFHLIRLANQRIDDCRRRIQNQQLGRRGRKADPLYRIRRRLTVGVELLEPDRIGQIHELLDAGDPSGHLRQIWWAKEQLRSIFDHPVRGHGAAELLLLAEAWMKTPYQRELRALGRTIWRWRIQILNWFLHHQISNGPTESVNNRIKLVKRIAFGFRRFHNYRIRALPYAGKSNWDLLATLTISR